MDSIKFLLTLLFKLAVVSLFVGIVWWFVINFYPNFRIQSMLSVSGNASSTATGIGSLLPSPRAFKARSAPVPSGDSNVTYGETFNGYGTNQNGGKFDYIAYKEAGVQMAEGKGVLPSGNIQNATQTQNITAPSNMIIGQFSPKNVYIRNLSMFEGGHVYTGLTFTGEARNTMFVNGRFPVIIAEQSSGRVVSIVYAEATTNPAVAGWVTFRVKLGTVTLNNIPCFMILEQGRLQNVQSSPVRVALPVTCN